MKSYLSVVLIIVCVLLAGALLLTRHSDNAQMATDATTIADFSNRLDTAYALITTNQGTILTLTNRLAECASASLTLSNRLTETIALQTEQLTNLNRQITAALAENETLGRKLADSTHQVAALNGQLAQTRTDLTDTQKTLAEAGKQNALLQHAFLLDVAQRVVTERKFNNPDALRNQLQELKDHYAVEISAERIYAGLNVEVTSNGLARVISPD